MAPFWNPGTAVLWDPPPTPTSALRRIKRVAVKKLFGIYDHTIELKLDERVTVVHGPNGVGKTMILKLLAAMFAGRLWEFARVPLQRFEVELATGELISIEVVGARTSRERDPKAEQSQVQLRMVSARGKERTANLTFGNGEDLRWERLLQAKVPGLGHVGPNRWFDSATGRSMSTAEALDIYWETLPALLRTGRRMPGEPVWFVRARMSVNIHLIETQRLLRLAPVDSLRMKRSRSPMVPTVHDHAQDLVRRVTEILAHNASTSQSLDQSFPHRLLRARTNVLSQSAIKTKMAALDQKRQQLKSIGLLEDDANPIEAASLDNLDKTEQRAMTLYVRDTAKKLGGLDDLARRIEILRDKVNGKFRHKSIRFERETGFTAIDREGRPLSLDSLSSGEQHELVLLYDLLFHVRPDSLVLIDEPELSLHVLWQKRFMPDLLAIVKAAQFDALVATHSPFIVGDRSDLLVALDAEAA